MADLIYFLAASGAVAWGCMIWKGASYVVQSVKRVRWALFGYRKRPPRRTA